MLPLSLFFIPSLPRGFVTPSAIVPDAALRNRLLTTRPRSYNIRNSFQKRLSMTLARAGQHTGGIVLAHHKSAIKRIRQNEKKRQRNRYVTTTMRSAIKKLEQAVQAQQTSDAQTLLQKTVSIIDRAASKGVIHKNKASRSVSRLTQKVKALS